MQIWHNWLRKPLFMHLVLLLCLKLGFVYLLNILSMLLQKFSLLFLKRYVVSSAGALVLTSMQQDAKAYSNLRRSLPGGDIGNNTSSNNNNKTEPTQ